MGEFPLTVLGEDGSAHACIVSTTGGPPWSISLRSDVTGEHHAEGSDLFDCLMNLRQMIEPKGWRILCNGARFDAWPSAMARQMGGGGLVYLATERETEPRRARLVPTFGPADAKYISNVDEQRKYYLTTSSLNPFRKGSRESR